VMQLVFWVIPLTVLAGATTAYLQANERFVMPSLGTATFNLAVIIALLFYVNQGQDLPALGIGVLAGGFLRWLSQLFCLPRLTKPWVSLRIWRVHRALVLRYVQALGAGGLMLLLPVIALPFVSFEGSGSIASYNYARKLLELPLGVCLGVFPVVLFPRLSQLYARDQFEDGLQLTRNGILLQFSLAFPIVLLLMWFSHDLTSIAYEWGTMASDNILEISQLVAIGVIALPAQGMFSLLLAEFNARLNTKTPLLLSLVGVAVFLLVVGNFQRGMGLKGIMFTLIGVYWMMVFGQLVLLWWQHDINVLGGHVIRNLIWVMISSLVVFLPCTWLFRWIDGDTILNVLMVSVLGLLMVGGNYLFLSKRKVFQMQVGNFGSS